MKFRVLLLLLISGALLAGCVRGEAEAKPPAIRYGEDLCTECNMIISDPRYAAGYAHEISPGRYESLAFDDIGDLLVHLAKHPERNIVAWYVHDYASEEWLDATTAYYVISKEIASPMGHGIIAYATRAAAEQMGQAKAGAVVDWVTLLAQAKAGDSHAHHSR
jgi:copper chaperone NosL